MNTGGAGALAAANQRGRQGTGCRADIHPTLTVNGDQDLPSKATKSKKGKT
jgi:hypothetical protein